MTARYIYMNGTQFNPSEVEITEDKIGESRRMGDGTLRYYHRAVKRKWSIKWTGLRETYLPAIRTIFALTTSFTFTDYDSVSYTVLVLPGGFSYTLSAEKVDAAGVKRYDVQLTLDEV